MGWDKSCVWRGRATLLDSFLWPARTTLYVSATDCIPDEFVFGSLCSFPGKQTSALDKIVMTKDFSALGGTLAVSPKYNVGGDADLSVGYAFDNTSVKVDTAGKKVTVAHCFNGVDTISPTVNAAGDVSLSYTRTLDKGQVKTTYTPGDSVVMQWSDGVYETTFKAPIEGYYKTNGGIRVTMKRTVGL
jgi:hypothetical protein